MSQTKAQLLGGVGISSAVNLVVGSATTFTEDLVVQGDARVTGILTVGTSSITLDGTNNQINVGSAVTISSSTGLSGSGANLTSLNASNLASGTLPDARFPATLPTASGVNLTSLNASNLSSGTVATARLGTGTADSSSFLRGDQTWAAAGGGAWEFISSVTASSSATVEFTSGIDSSYGTYAIIWENVINTSTNGSGLRMVYSSDGGSTWLTSTYRYIGVGARSGTSTPSIESISNGADMQISDDFTSTGFSSGLMYLYNPSVSSPVACKVSSHGWNGAGGTFPNIAKARETWGWYNSNITVNAIQIFITAQTITSGTFRLYGIKSS